MQIVRGGGLEFMTEDPFLITAVKRCADLERQLTEARHDEVARYRTLRRDVSQIKRAMRGKPDERGG